MHKIAVQSPSKEAVRISDVLSHLGFNLQLLSSMSHVKKQLEFLTKEQLTILKEAFSKNAHPRLIKEFEACQHGAYGKKADYVKGIKGADTSKMVKLIRLVGVLLQSKVYLFWQFAKTS
jgi:hypothetical protein